MKRLLLIISMMILFTLGLSACVGSANASNTVTLHANMTEFAYTPSTWTVPAGKQVSDRPAELRHHTAHLDGDVKAGQRLLYGSR